MITVSNASLRYSHKVIFDQLTFSFQENQWTAIIGPSGIGKSSLLKLMAGLLTDEKAAKTTLILNNNLSIKNDIAYLPQDDLLLPWLTVYDNLLIGSKLHPVSIEKKWLLQKVNTLLETVQLLDAKTLYPHQLSGGMRQRLALARLLLQDKPIIFMDEPFKSLDAMTRFHLQTLAATLLRNKTVVFITHDLQEAARLAHTIYFMNGKPPTLAHAATLQDAIPRDLTAQNVIDTQATIYPLWSAS